ncbi:MAG TPA: shikimate kinase [Gemmataceae bacterium]
MTSSSLLFLIGARGSGKSTVGRVLAQRLGWPFLDADDCLEEASGRAIAAIFAKEGEKSFRDREAAILADLSQRTQHVIATGGGVVLRPANRIVLKNRGFVAWLQTSPEAAFARLQADPTTPERRPNLTPAGGLEELRTILAAREPLYRDCADFALDTAALSPDAAAAAILTAWRSTSRSSSGASSSSSSA